MKMSGSVHQPGYKADRDDRIALDIPSHVYNLAAEKGNMPRLRSLLSVSSVLGTLFRKFDAWLRLVGAMRRGRARKVAFKKRMVGKGVISTFLHAVTARYLVGCIAYLEEHPEATGVPSDLYENYEDKGAVVGVAAWSDVRAYIATQLEAGWRPYRVEMPLFDEEIGIGGTPDVIWWRLVVHTPPTPAHTDTHVVTHGRAHIQPTYTNTSDSEIERKH